MKDIFHLLNIKETATIEEIEEAYRNMKRRLNLAGLEQGSDDWMKIARIRQTLDKAYYDLMADIIFAPANVVTTGHAPLISGESPVGKPRPLEKSPQSQYNAAPADKTPPPQTQGPVRPEEPRGENVRKDEPARAQDGTPIQPPAPAAPPITPMPPAPVPPPVSQPAAAPAEPAPIQVPDVPEPKPTRVKSHSRSGGSGITVGWKYLVSQNIWQIIFIAAAFFLTVVVSYFPIDDIMQKEIIANADKDLQLVELRIKLSALEAASGEYGGNRDANLGVDRVFRYVGAFSSVAGSEGMLLDDQMRVIAHRDRNMLNRHISEIWNGLRDSGGLKFTDGSFSRIVSNGDREKEIVVLRKIYNGWTVGFAAPLTVFYRGIAIPAVRLSAMGIIMCVLLNYLLLRLSRDKIRSEEESKSKTAFLARMSHEIRTPMNAILGMSELALETEDRDIVKNYIAIISQAGRNLLAIINDILDFSKAEAGSVDITPAPYRLSSLLVDVVSVVQVSLIDKPIVFAVDAAYELPENLVGDSTRVRQILINILSNAVKYTHEGYIKLSVSCVKTGEGEILLRFEVADSGIGIRHEDIGKIFDNFVRLNSSRTNWVEGSGLGLTIAKNLCRAMKGDITAESVYGDGSVFAVTLPQTIQDDERIASVRDAGNRRVLLFDNRPVYGDTVYKALVSLGLKTTRTEDEGEFLKQLSHGNYHFAFVSPKISDEAAACRRERGLSTQIALLAAMGENLSSKGLPVVLMPAFTIPLANFLNGKTGASPQALKRQDAPFTAPSARVLIVDDNLTNLKVAEGLLMQYKMRMDTCESGKDAIALAKAVRYDLIFMDHMMPEMDGIQTTQALRAIKACERTPIVALTANAVVGMREMFLKNGMDDFLSKPIDRAKLYAILRKWLPTEKQQTAFVPGDDEEKLFTNSYLPFTPIDGADLERCFGNNGSNREAFLDVIHTYVARSRLIIEKLRDPGSNLSEYFVYIHELKGSSYGICAHKVGKMAESLEQAAERGDIETVKLGNCVFIATVETLLSNLRAVEESMRRAQSGSLVRNL
jgi:signal transduction histidine kinase/CheY-like chemotaxis protein